MLRRTPHTPCAFPSWHAALCPAGYVSNDVGWMRGINKHVIAAYTRMITLFFFSCHFALANNRESKTREHRVPSTRGQDANAQFKDTTTREHSLWRTTLGCTLLNHPRVSCSLYTTLQLQIHHTTPLSLHRTDRIQSLTRIRIVADRTTVV